MSTINKAVVGIIIMTLIVALVWALEMVDWLAGFLVLSLCLFVAFGLLKESAYEALRAFVSEGGLTNDLKQAIKGMTAE